MLSPRAKIDVKVFISSLIMQVKKLARLMMQVLRMTIYSNKLVEQENQGWNTTKNLIKKIVHNVCFKYTVCKCEHGSVKLVSSRNTVANWSYSIIIMKTTCFFYRWSPQTNYIIHQIDRSCLEHHLWLKAEFWS